MEVRIEKKLNNMYICLKIDKDWSISVWIWRQHPILDLYKQATKKWEWKERVSLSPCISKPYLGQTCVCGWWLWACTLPVLLWLLYVTRLIVLGKFLLKLKIQVLYLVVCDCSYYVRILDEKTRALWRWEVSISNWRQHCLTSPDYTLCNLWFYVYLWSYSVTKNPCLLFLHLSGVAQYWL